MCDFRVELDAIKQLAPFQRDRRAVLVRCQNRSAVRDDLYCVRVAHPDLRFFRNTRIQPVAALWVQIRRPVFTAVARLDRSAELQVQKLHAVAHAQHRNSKTFQRLKVQIGSIRLAGAPRPPGENDRPRLPDVGKILERVKLREIPQLPNPPHNELRVLRTEIYDCHMALVVHLLVFVRKC